MAFTIFFLKKICPWKNEKNCPQKLFIIGPEVFFIQYCTGLPIWPKIKNPYRKLGWGTLCCIYFVFKSSVNERGLDVAVIVHLVTKLVVLQSTILAVETKGHEGECYWVWNLFVKIIHFLIMTRASSGSDRKIISRPIGQFFFGISEIILYIHKQWTKNYNYFKCCHYHNTKKVLKSIFWPIEIFSKTLK